VDISQQPLILYHPKGCAACYHGGYQGRMGIYELIQIDNEFRDAIYNQATTLELEALARKQTISIRDNGFEQVRQGLTSLDEVLRVTREG
jgi:general secretion pathway protein E